MASEKVGERMERLSNILVYARDCDVHVLEDLHKWLNHLAVKWLRLSKPDYAANAAAAAAVVARFILQQKDSRIVFASGGSTESHSLRKRRRQL